LFESEIRLGRASERGSRGSNPEEILRHGMFLFCPALSAVILASSVPTRALHLLVVDSWLYRQPVLDIQDHGESANEKHHLFTMGGKVYSKADGERSKWEWELWEREMRSDQSSSEQWAVSSERERERGRERALTTTERIRRSKITTVLIYEVRSRSRRRYSTI